MNETTEKPSKQVKHKSHTSLMYLLLIVIAGGVAGWYLYQSQHDQVNTLTSKNANLNAQLSTLSGQVNTAKAAGNITTSGWKTYCDPHGIFCFKYPPNWSIDSSYVSDPQIGGVTITNQTKNLSISYLDNYIKDDFPADFIVHSITALNVGDNNLAIMGGYYIETVEDTPDYQIVNLRNSANDFAGEPSPTDKPGQNIFAGAVPIFEYSGGTYKATDGELLVQPINEDFSTTQKADAWFNSINGKTAYKILDSLSIHQQ